MTPLDAVALLALLALPFHWAVMREFARLEDASYLRARGVVVLALSAIEAHSEPLGRYRGRDIWRTVTFKGMVYRFDRVIPAAERDRIGRGELYLEPGLVYAAI